MRDDYRRRRGSGIQVACHFNMSDKEQNRKANAISGFVQSPPMSRSAAAQRIRAPAVSGRKRPHKTIVSETARWPTLVHQGSRQTAPTENWPRRRETNCSTSEKDPANQVQRSPGGIHHNTVGATPLQRRSGQLSPAAFVDLFYNLQYLGRTVQQESQGGGRNRNYARP
jgi:hypothetical protein